MTYESLVAEFRLRVLKTDEDYDAAKAFWDERVSLAMKFCRLHDADSVQDYAEVLTLLMANYEQEKLDECEDEEDFEEEDSDPTEPAEGDWVTEDDASCSVMVFYEHGQNGKVVVKEGQDWRNVLKSEMDQEQYWPNVWHLSDHGNYTLLILEDEE